MTLTLKGLKDENTHRCSYTVMCNQSVVFAAFQKSLCDWWDVLICFSFFKHQWAWIPLSLKLLSYKSQTNPDTSQEIRTTLSEPDNIRHMRHVSTFQRPWRLCMSKHNCCFLHVRPCSGISSHRADITCSFIVLWVGRKPDLRTTFSSTFVICAARQHAVICLPCYY